MNTLTTIEGSDATGSLPGAAAFFVCAEAPEMPTATMSRTKGASGETSNPPGKGVRFPIARACSHPTVYMRDRRGMAGASAEHPRHALGHPANGARSRPPHRVTRLRASLSLAPCRLYFAPAPVTVASAPCRQTSMRPAPRLVRPAAPRLLRFGRPAAAVRRPTLPSPRRLRRRRRGRRRPAPSACEPGPAARCRPAHRLARGAFAPCLPPARSASATPPARAELRLADALPSEWEGEDITVVGIVDDLPQPLGARHALRVRRRAHADARRDRSGAPLARLVRAAREEAPSPIRPRPSPPANAGSSSFG